MNKFIVALAATISVSACGGSGNPFNQDTGNGNTGGTTPDPSRPLPPGTETPTASGGILRREPTSTGPKRGDGFAQSISYNAANDVFTVDNLAFDGDNNYARSTAVANLGPFAVYESPATTTDRFDGTPIAQLGHRAIYGQSTSGNTRFAIVRTGNYVDFGFGGFVYQRDNGVTLPTSGQATYSGKMAGIRDFNGSGGLQYTTADVALSIDFDDFNDATNSRGDAVRGTISNRRILDATTGADITPTVLAAFNTAQNTTLTAIPDALFRIGPGVMDNNGEILGELNSNYVTSGGQTASFESGKYYALVSGENTNEIVGVVVLDGQVPVNGVTARETGGFIVYN